MPLRDHGPWVTHAGTKEKKVSGKPEEAKCSREKPVRGKEQQKK